MYAFIDESGDHNLDEEKSDGVYDIFVLGSVLIEKGDYSDIDKEFKSIKTDIFGSDDFIIHTAELTHPMNKKSDPRNRIMRDPVVRKRFYDTMGAFLKKIPVKATFCVVIKKEFREQYAYPFDPYELAFENILNRILYGSASNEIEILPECRNSELDKRMAGEFAKYSAIGAKFYTPEEITSRVKKFECVDKKENLSGHQIADLLSTPVGRRFLGFTPKPEGNEIPFSLVKEKIPDSWMLTVFPR